MRETESTCLILFGAGASAFAGGVRPHNPPPGNQLFQKLVAFDSYFATLPGNLVREFNDNFERGMKRFHDEHNTELSKFLCLMSLYFLQFEIDSAAQSKNFYVRFLGLLDRLQAPAGYFATLNYDLLLEDALSGLDLNPRDVMKLHGSPNYLIAERVAGFFRGPIVAAYQRKGIIDSDDPSRVATRSEAADCCRRWIAEQVPIAPMISLYAEGKRVLHNASHIARIQRMFKAAVQDSTSILLVGVNLHLVDEHIWGPIADRRVPIGVVNPDYSPFEEWGRAHQLEVSQIAATTDALFLPDSRRRLHDHLNR